MFLYKAILVYCVNGSFDRYDDNVAQHIAISLIVTVRPCLPTLMSSEEKVDSLLVS